MIGFYTWGRCHPADLVRPPGSPLPEQTRPALGNGAWNEIDRTLETVLRGCSLELMVVLGITDAEDTARGIYVFYEPMVDAVIALGHGDRSISWHVTDNLVPPNEAPLRAILDDAGQELQRGDLVSALMSIAANIQRLTK